jgi:hypothetical protein
MLPYLFFNQGTQKKWSAFIKQTRFIPGRRNQPILHLLSFDATEGGGTDKFFESYVFHFSKATDELLQKNKTSNSKSLKNQLNVENHWTGYIDHVFSPNFIWSKVDDAAIPL